MKMLLCLVAFITMSMLTPALGQASSPLVVKESPGSRDLRAFTKWTALLPRYQAQRHQEIAACKDSPPCLPEQWEGLLKQQIGQVRIQQLEAVNQFFNAIRYVEDKDNFGQDDVWQTPYELMAKGGDCEDYAIAKYISLKRLGVPERNMRIMIVQDQNLGGILHAILEVNVDGNVYILDNQASAVAKASDIYHYIPIYAINAKFWWAYV